MPALLALSLLLAATQTSTAEPGRARALLEEARVLLEDGQSDDALVKLEEAIDQDVDLRAAYEEAIPLWVSKGELAQLRRRLERVTARHQDFAVAWYALGYAYRKGGRADLAVLAYQSYISLRPGEAAPYFGMAMALKSVGDSARAERAFVRYMRNERDPLRSDFVDRARRELALLVWQRYWSSWTSSQSGQ